MNKFDFLREAFAHRAYKRKEWLLSVCTIGFEDEESKAILSPHPYAVWIEGNSFKFHDHEGNVQTLEGDVLEPVFNMADTIDLTADFHPVLQGQAVKSTFGIFLFNVVMFYEAVGHVIPYQNRELTPGLIRDWISDIMVDDPPEGESVPEGKAPVRDVLKISKNANFLEGILYAIVKCGSKDSLTVSKEVIDLKNRLLKENKDRLSDPLVFNDIVEQCVNLDYEIQMKGESATFYIDKSYVSNCRKRMFIMFGIEFNSETNSWVPLVDPLTKGWDPRHMVDYINTAIEGAYNRGKATGEGGARVKDILRIMGSKRVVEENCGSKQGELIMLWPTNKKLWLGCFVIDNGKDIMLTNDNWSKYEGKVVPMRAMQFCLTGEGDYCKTCAGKGLGATATRLPAAVSRTATVFMLLRMKASHISGTSNSKVAWDQAFR